MAISAVALLLRVVPVAQASFPFGDGGLLVGLIRDILRDGPGLPAWASYNGGVLPYAYPPLALYGVAGLSALTGISVLLWVQWLPPLLSTALVPAGYLLVRRASGSVHLGLAAALFLAVSNGYQNLILGGGLTKATGLLLAMLAVERGLALLERPSSVRIATTGGLAGLAALAHPAASLFVILSLGWAWVVQSRRERTLLVLVASGVLAGIVALPWLLSVLHAHGAAPLLSAASINRTALGALAALLSAFWAVHPLPVFGVLMLTGLIHELRVARWFAPGWLLLIVAIDQRNAYMTGLPAAGWLVAVGWQIGVVAPAKQLVARWPQLRSWRRPALALLSCALVLPFLLWPSQPLALGPRRALSQGDQAAATWLATHTAPGTRVAIITGRLGLLDEVSEWMPELSGRISVATPQGSEWLGAAVWRSSIQRHDALQECAAAGVACLERWAAAYRVMADLVYVPGPGSSLAQLGIGGLAAPLGLGAAPKVDCCASVRGSLDAAHVPLLYSSPAARIYTLSLGGPSRS